MKKRAASKWEYTPGEWTIRPDALAFPARLLECAGMDTTDKTPGAPAGTADILARAKAAAETLNDALREAARRDVALSIAIVSEPLTPDGPGPEVNVVELGHRAHQEGLRPEDLSSANDD
ncbi:hypothetical protein [Jiella avicenniae]|uniref:Uncharacterized protein n=1 Tax=Jiella avicenniae TaxID=2907202 RepID=A0A9X1TBS0_9HYPH|nr:hypothetical protein [Jiella avicenniae]MCE7028303.1 hypothetical protein [Jiella avicenniae]